LHSSLVQHFRDTSDLENLQATHRNKANIFYVRGKLDEVMALYKEEERICRQLGKPDGLAISLINQAL